MINRFALIRNPENKNYVLPFLFLIFWVCLWIMPWQSWLVNWPWFRMLISIGMYILPGAFIYHLFSENPTNLSGYISVGFVISSAIISILGLIARWFHFPFSFLVVAFSIIGGIFIVIFWISKQKVSFGIQGLFSSVNKVIWTLVTIALLIFVASKSSTSNIYGDNSTYIGYLTNWQNSQDLDFTEPFLDSGNSGNSRWLIMSFPMCQAVLAQISGLHGILLIGYYLAPFLTVIAWASLFELTRSLNLSKSFSQLSIFAQITFLLLLMQNHQSGYMFFNRLTEDKVSAAFLFAPILFCTGIKYLAQTSRKSLFLLSVSGLSMILIHPIIFAFCAMVLSIYGILESVNSRCWKQYTIMMVLVIILLSMPALMRFLDPTAKDLYLSGPDEENIGFNDRSLTIPGTLFYSFDPRMIKLNLPEDGFQILAEDFPWEMITFTVLTILACLSSYKRISRFFLAAIIPIFLAGIPYTGWILGYFIGARMLWRIVWLYPFGIGFSILIKVLIDKSLHWKHSSHWVTITNRIPEIFSASLMVTIVLLILTFQHQYFERNKYSELSHFQNLANISKTFDSILIDEDIVVGDKKLNSIIPSLSKISKVISMRNIIQMQFYGQSLEESTQRFEEWNLIIDKDSKAAERITILNKYDVHFLLYDSDGYQKWIRDLKKNYPEYFKEVVQYNNIVLLEYIDH